MMPEPDPIDALAVGVAADHTAKKRGRKPKEVAVASGEEAQAEAVEAGAAPDEAAALGEVVAEKVAEAVNEAPPAEPAPAAPGDDHDSVFDRRLARLNTIVEEAVFDTGTAFGDLRDVILDLFKHRDRLWSAMPPSERQDVTRHVEAMAKQILGKVVLVVAQEDSAAIKATLLAAFTVKGDAIEAKIKVGHVDNDGLMDFAKLAGHEIMLVDASDKRFMSARRAQDHGRDQLDMPFADAGPPAPRAAEALPTFDDDDLADGADDDHDDRAEAAHEAAEDVEEPAPGSFGVFDTVRGQWLTTDDFSDDAAEAWSINSADAARWDRDHADEVAQEFSEPERMSVRLIGEDVAEDAGSEEPGAQN